MSFFEKIIVNFDFPENIGIFEKLKVMKNYHSKMLETSENLNIEPKELIRFEKYLEQLMEKAEKDERNPSL